MPLPKVFTDALKNVASHQAAIQPNAMKGLMRGKGTAAAGTMLNNSVQNRPLTRDVANNALMGGLMGGLVGGGLAYRGALKAAKSPTIAAVQSGAGATVGATQNLNTLVSHHIINMNRRATSNVAAKAPFARAMHEMRPLVGGATHPFSTRARFRARVSKAREARYSVDLRGIDRAARSDYRNSISLGKKQHQAEKRGWEMSSRAYHAGSRMPHLL